MADNDFTKNNDENNPEKVSDYETLKNSFDKLCTGVSQVFNICSEMLNNEETYREYGSEIEKTSKAGIDIQGSYNLGIKLGNLKNTNNASKLKSIPPSKYQPPKIDIVKKDEEIIIEITFKNIIKEEVNIIHKDSLVINARGGKMTSKELDFNQTDYKIEEIEYNFPHLKLILLKVK